MDSAFGEGLRSTSKGQKKGNKPHMSYKFYRNRKTRNHPSIEIESSDKSWKNLEMTSSPTKSGKYIELQKNPDPLRNGKAYVRKYVRNDPIRTRGDLLRRYSLSEKDLKEIEKFLKNHRKNKKR